VTLPCRAPAGAAVADGGSPTLGDPDDLALTALRSDLGQPEVAEQGATATRGGGVVLVVEDNADMRAFLINVLAESYRVETASNGREGLEQALQLLPDLILSDVMMPEMSGEEMARLLQARPETKDIPLLFLTAKQDASLRARYLAEGARDCLSKPFSVKELRAKVERLVAERQRTQRDLRDREEEIREQRDSLAVFTRALAHDLKEPARTIRAYTELLSEEPLTAQGQGFLQHLLQGADRLLMLIETVFHYTRLDEPEQTAPEPCETSAVLEEALARLGPLIRQRGAVIERTELPLVQAPRAQLLQLFLSLLSNAIHHTDEVPRVRVSAERWSGRWLFRVHDNGPGIPPEHRQSVFLPFKRLNPQHVQGAGLGLAVCRKIVEGQGGRIWCEGPPEGGATLCFTLPGDAAAAASPGAAGDGAPRPANGRLSLANVLLVDDREADLDLTRILLIRRARIRCNLLVARGGEEALELLRQGAPDGGAIHLVLLDINMPGLDGFDVLEHVRAERLDERSVVVMCTCSTHDKDVQRARALGAAGYLVKPPQFDALKDVIERSAAGRLELSPDENGGYVLSAHGAAPRAL
jgi:CheY-like chemotaxis protein